MHWLRTLVLTSFIAGLQYPLWYGKGGFNEVKQLGEQVKEQQALVEKLALRNKALTAQIQDLKEGKEAIAEIARDELGFIKSGEHYYRVKN